MSMLNSQQNNFKWLLKTLTVHALRPVHTGGCLIPLINQNCTIVGIRSLCTFKRINRESRVLSTVCAREG